MIILILQSLILLIIRTRAGNEIRYPHMLRHMPMIMMQYMRSIFSPIRQWLSNMRKQSGPAPRLI